MSLVTRISATFAQVAADIKSLVTNVGSPSALTTTAKTNLVAAINEVKASVGTSGAAINDASTTSTSTTWSAQKSTAAIAQLKTDILGGATASYDTMIELQNIIVADESTAAALATAVNNRVRFDAAQVLSAPQMTQVCTNIGVGEPETDFLTAYNTAKA